MPDETGSGDRSNVIPIPTDLTLDEYSLGLIESHKELFETFKDDLALTIEQTRTAGEPESFAYAKMIRYFTDYLEPYQLAQIAASALWRVHHDQVEKKED